MTTRTYAIQANAKAGNARVRAFQPCMASAVFASWSEHSLGTATKHGRSRRPEVSHP